MADAGFVHLHVHTHYSLLDGATRIEALVERAKAFNMPAVAITDHGNLFGAIEFYNAARKAGVKPIIGCETYMASGDRRAKSGQEGRDSYHLLLLAMNLTGYQNLLKLASAGYTEGFYRKPRIDKEILREFSQGLICTSTCIGGEIPQAFLNKDRKAAEDTAKTYLEIFGPDRFFIELQDHNMPEQRMLNPELLDMANRLGVAAIATNDVHYLEHDDVEAHDVLCCINTGKLQAEEDRFKFPTDQFYFKTAEEMAALFPGSPDALSNTLALADMCNLELDLTKRHAPVYRVPDSVVGDSGEPLDDAAYLNQLVYQGAKQRYGEITPELGERIDYELEVITSKGFASYFLIVWDCVNYAREHGIPVGARGSGCSSVVAHCLYISTPDPIRYGLYFERFMDPDRDEMPDIDLDICQNGRAQIIDYVRQKYGHVAQIITFGTLKAKAVIKDVARVLGVGFDQANQLTKLIPNELKMTLDKALDREPELRKQYDLNPTVKKIVDIGKRLEGVARNAGIHAAGVVVADQPLENFLPLYKAPGQDTIITQFDGPTVEMVGLLKMDFLGLRTLSILERARQLAQKSAGKSIDISNLDLQDQKVYDLFIRGDTKGVFQFESGGMRDVIMRMKPNRIEDLIAANALYRPGPMEYIPDYIARKHGKAWTTPHDTMTEVLGETYGIMVYQEQVSRLVNRLGNIELKAAFRLAKAISKKKTQMIEAMRTPFLSGCEANGVARSTGEQIFEDILKFGGYAFNKAHSTGYALVAFQTAWMKAYYPVEFMAALMTFEMSSTDKIAEYREACKGMSIAIAPPCVNASGLDFEVDRSSVDAKVSDKKPSPLTATDNDTDKQGIGASIGAIRFGLGAIKGVGSKAVDAIVAERQIGGSYKSLFDFCERVDLGAVNRGAMESLICAGAFDKTGAMRRAMVEALDRAVAGGQSAQSDRRSGQMGLFGGGDVDDEKQDSEPVLSAAEWTEADMLAREKAVLGFYITKHPLSSHEAMLRACSTATTVDLNKYQADAPVTIGGMVSTLRTVLSKNGRNAGRKLGIITLEDLHGRIEAVVFPNELVKFQSLLVPDAIVFLEGKVDRKREEPSIRVTNVIDSKDAAQSLASALVLSVTKETAIDELVELLKSNPGQSPVYLDVQSVDGFVAQIQCNPAIKVACEAAFIAKLQLLLGSDAVTVLGVNRNAIPIAAVTNEPVVVS